MARYTNMKVYTDADWAGCRETRRSTIGGCVMLGTHALKAWSKTQALMALSSGESELYAALKASVEALGMVALMKDFGYELKGEVWGDASAALGIINRKGLGKTRHIQTGVLWIQQAAADQRLRYGKVPGKENPADLYTTFLDAATISTHIRKLEYGYIDGRLIEVPQLQILSQTIDEYRNGQGYEPCEWVQTLVEILGTNRDVIQQQKTGVRTIACVTTGDATHVRRATPQDCHDAQPSIVYDQKINGQHKHRKSSIHTINGGPNNGSSKHVKWCQAQLISPARFQSEELYCTERQGVGIRRNSGGDT